MKVFTDDLRALHRTGFVHCDLQRPSSIGGYLYDNISLTDRGIRLLMLVPLRFALGLAIAYSNTLYGKNLRSSNDSQFFSSPGNAL